MARITNLASHSYPYVTVQELAECLLCNEKTIRRHIDKGALPVVRVGDLVRISIEAARTYARETPNGD